MSAPTIDRLLLRYQAEIPDLVSLFPLAPEMCAQRDNHTRYSDPDSLPPVDMGAASRSARELWDASASLEDAENGVA